MPSAETLKPNDYVIHDKPACVVDSGFFDPDDVDNPDAEMAIILRRTIVDEEEWFVLERPIAYWDAQLGAIVVPGETQLFLTDLVSVPRLVTWLVPRTGSHLPAALIHDGLIPLPGEGPTYVATSVIGRVDADRVFRDAMKDVDTPPLSRWLIWTAVAAATKVHSVADPSARQPKETSRWSLLGWLVVLGTVASIVTLGTLATLEILDCISFVGALQNRSMIVELGIGVAAAATIPCVFSMAWYREWRAGIIAGVAVSMLLHIMVALVIVFGFFQAMNHASAKNFGAAFVWLTVSLATIAALASLVSFVC